MKNHIWIRAVGMRYLRIIALAWDIILCPVVMFSPAFQAFLLDPEIDDFQKRQEAGGKQERGKTNGWVDVLFAIFQSPDDSMGHFPGILSGAPEAAKNDVFVAMGKTTERFPEPGL